jgi:hypothetical protein
MRRWAKPDVTGGPAVSARERGTYAGEGPADHGHATPASADMSRLLRWGLVVLIAAAATGLLAVRFSVRDEGALLGAFLLVGLYAWTALLSQ